MEYSFKFDSEQDYENFRVFLQSQKKVRSEEEANKHRAIVNTKKEVLGIPMQPIREIAKQISKDCPLEFLKYAENDIYEELLIKGLVIASLNDKDRLFLELEKYIRQIDSWAFCDSVVSTMKWLKKTQFNEKYFEYFYNLCFESEEFVARFGIVTLMVYYIDDEHIDKVLYMCKSVHNEKFYVQMAISWLVSVSFVKYREKTYKLLESKVLDKFTQNKSISKCRDSFRVSSLDKENLIQFRIK